jgi:hypothetical protein
MVGYMRRATSPAMPGNSGAMKTEMIFCGRGGYEDIHQDVDGSMHASADSFHAFDFRAPGPMEDISRAVAPRLSLRLLFSHNYRSAEYFLE